MKRHSFTLSLSKGVLLLALLFTACDNTGPNGERIYTYNDLMLVTGYTAKDACSCMFVMEQTEEYCRAWTKANPALGHFTFDKTSKTVTSSAAVLWSATARYVDDTVGCQLQP
jgi:hypothetical protein